jgi:predicted amidohydrolase
MASETSPTGRVVRAAVVQAASVAFDREATLDKVADWTARASVTGAELVVFPAANTNPQVAVAFWGGQHDDDGHDHGEHNGEDD